MSEQKKIRKSKTENLKRVFLSVFVLIVVLILTITGFLFVHSHMEQKCIDELRSITKEVDWQLNEILDNTFISLDNYATIISDHCDFDREDIIRHLKSMYVGDMHMEERLYLPDGTVITENGVMEGVSGPDEYDEILKGFDERNRYISCTKLDYVYTDKYVMEMYYPVISGGKTEAVISAVMDLSGLKERFKASGYKTAANVILADRRDGTYFLDTDHDEITKVENYRDRLDKNGDSIVSSLDRMMAGEELYYTIKSKRSGVILYTYSVPSGAYSFWSTSISMKEDYAFASDFYVRKLMITIAIGEVLLFLLYILWLQKSNRREAKAMQDLTIAQAENRAKTEFMFNMSHDIRTPMNAIIGFTNMALKHIDDDKKVLDCLEKTQKAGMMLLSLINSILEVSRIESGHATLDEQPGDIYDSFVVIESTMREMAELKDIELSFEFGEISDRYVCADFSRCMRVFVNVISNAIKYTREGGYVKVRCEQEGEVKDGIGTYQYTVSDNGIGMSEEFQKHVFEQFSREKTSTVSGIQGTGLGMAVCKSFVELMGGSITVKSRQGEGSTFTILLPFKLQSEESVAASASEEKKKAEFKINSDQISFAGRNVLLVEDNELNREISIDLLEEQGFVVEDVDDGSLAVEKMKEKGPDFYDIILMDIQMPIMNGYDATRAIREMYPDRHIPIIALSANAFAEDRKRSLNAGMDEHIAKPIDLLQLKEKLAGFLT